MGFEIKLPLFEGPFDLLLFFIERDELDIYDIPISKITDDFLEYLNHLEQKNIEIASEFILVAATLMRIKAKMLLPRPAIDEEGNEIDPREELVAHLLEYKRYKSVLQELQQLEVERQQKQTRGNIDEEVKQLAKATKLEAELQDLDLYKLLKVFMKVMDKFENRDHTLSHRVAQYPYTIAGQKEYILKEITTKPKISFEAIITNNPTKIAVIFNFLAILELLQLRRIAIQIGVGYNNFWIEPPRAED